MDFEQLKTILSTLVSAGTVMIAVARWLRKRLTKMIQTEIKFIAIQLDEIHKQQKFLSERQDSMQKTLMKILAADQEIRQEAIKFDDELREILNQNTELLKELQLSKAEWISPNLVKVAGKKS